MMQLLRRMKSEAALLTALCDIGGMAGDAITQALTDIAVTSVQCALRFLLAQEAGRGRLLPPDPDRAEDGSGLVVLAMGKMGAGELNYSSDIDLIVFFNLDAPTLPRDIEPQPFFVRVTQAMARDPAAADRRRLCVPGRSAAAARPASTPVAISTAAALYYYEARGPDLGTCGHDQGAPLCRRPCRRRRADG